jgi:hypothetical protein
MGIAIAKRGICIAIAIQNRIWVFAITGQAGRATIQRAVSARTSPPNVAASTVTKIVQAIAAPEPNLMQIIALRKVRIVPVVPHKRSIRSTSPVRLVVKIHAPMAATEMIRITKKCQARKAVRSFAFSVTDSAQAVETALQVKTGRNPAPTGRRK